MNQVQRAVAAAFGGVPRVLLAVSGGRDSMVLLDAAARAATRPELIVATYDHGTGPAARAAAAVAARAARSHGLPCVIGRTGRRLAGEAEWREARWRFLREVAVRERAVVATAHTRDDQVETVVLRLLRDSGPRGLAGLYAPSDVIRPLLDVSRAVVAAYARQSGVDYVEDPSNTSRAYLRNRIRLDLLPAVTRARPEFAGEILSLARRAARWRAEIESVVESLAVQQLDATTVRIASGSLAGYDAEALRVLWPAIAARAGAVMDRRGTHRAAAFTLDELAGASTNISSGELARAAGASGSRGGTRVIQLSGGFEIARLGDSFVVRRWRR